MDNYIRQYKNTSPGSKWHWHDSDCAQWYIFVIVVFLIKLTIYFFDSTPMFFLGDSQVYLNTAVNGWIPTNRSFVYGFFIRLVTGKSHSLHNLILLQTILGGGAAIIAAYILRKFFAVSVKIAIIAGLLCAIEPLQLFYERYAMTETATIFVFAVYLLLVFCYLRRPTLLYLFVLQIVGLGLISLRMSYLPLVFVVTILLPLLGAWAVWSVSFGQKKRILGGLGSLIIHLVFSVGSMYLTHTSYKHLLGNLVDRPPAYRYEDGIDLITCWAPIIEPEDFSDRKLGQKVFSRLTLDPKKRKKRSAQRYWDGGLTHVMWNIIGRSEETDRIAKQTALHAAKRNPIGLFQLYLAGFQDYWNIGFLKGLMRLDRGCVNKPYPEQFLKFLADNFGNDASLHHCPKTITSRYFNNAWPWYPFLLLTPFVSIFLIFNRAVIWPCKLIILIFSSFLMTIPATFPDIRYIHPLGWLIFIVLPLLIPSSPAFFQVLNKQSPTD